MRLLLFALLFVSVSANAQLHCGYDFTSYVVLHVHEEGKRENISGLQIVLVDQNGNEVINKANQYSWNHKDESLRFVENYRIDAAGKRAAEDIDQSALRWFFPYSKDTYLLSVTNEFPADEMMVKITDPNGVYAEATHQLYSFNMYILCTTDAQNKAMQFGRRTNKPVDIILKRKNS